MSLAMLISSFNLYQSLDICDDSRMSTRQNLGRKIAFFNSRRQPYICVIS